MSKQEEIIEVAGKKVVMRCARTQEEACASCAFCSRKECHDLDCNMRDIIGESVSKYAYFVRTEEDEKKTQKALPEVIYCGRNCYGNLSYSNTKVLPNMRPYVPAEETEADLEVEAERFFKKFPMRANTPGVPDEYLDFGTYMLIARHFAEWGAEHLKK